MLPDTPLSVGLRGLLKPAGLIQIDIDAIRGECGTGFEKAGDMGEFECGNCIYFDAAAGACSQVDMMHLSKQPRLTDGRVAVDEEDCCTYVTRKGKIETHPNDDATGKY